MADLIPHDEKLGGRDVRWIELTRGIKANALNVGMLARLEELIVEVPECPIFISSRGKAFSAGLDLHELLKRRSAGDSLRKLIEVYKALSDHPSPTACIVESKAAAGGVGLALCADAVILTCDAWFTLPGRSLYRPLAEVLFPIVSGRRGVSEEDFESWYGSNVIAATLKQQGAVDRIVHRDPGEIMTGELKKVAVDVLESKDLYSQSAIASRPGRPDEEELARRVELAIAASERDEFQAALSIHFRKQKWPKRDPCNVFVVHGRNSRVKEAMLAFIKAVGLNPLKWEDMVRETGHASPFTGEVINAGLAIAQAMVVVMTGDDEARLLPAFHEPGDPSHEKNLTPQARPNVLIEAGMGLAMDERRTILVELGEVRPASDLLGRHAIRMNNTKEMREALMNRLEIAGCPVDHDGDWRTAGDFKG